MNQNQNPYENITNPTNQLKKSILTFKNEIKKLLSNPYHSLRNIKKIDLRLNDLIQSINNQKEESFIRKTSMDYLTLMNPTQNKGLSEGLSKFSYFPIINPCFSLENKENNEKDEADSGIKMRMTKYKDLSYSLHSNSKKIKNRKEINRNFHEEVEIIRKYDIDINSNSHFQLKNEIYTKSFKLKERLGKLSSQRLFKKKDFQYRKNEYDKYDKPIIIKEDFRGGLYEMINRGILPKNCDLTKAFSRSGNPFKLEVKEAKEVKEVKEVNDEIEEESKEENKENVFLTNINQSNQPNQPSIKQSITNNNQITTNKNQIKYINITQNSILKNKNFLLFKNENLSNWAFIYSLITYLLKTLKLLSISSAEIDCNNLLILSQSDKSQINKISLLNCISERDVKAKGFLKPEKLLSLVKDSAVVTIQRVYKGYLIRKKFKIEKMKNGNISKIQSIFRLSRLIKICKTLIDENNEISLWNWTEMMKRFKSEWENIRVNPRIEIHINSISYSSPQLSSLTKYSQRQNNQLTRLIRLSDPNITIIYVTPYEIPSDVISYFFSILDALGIKNFKERLFFIVPETVSILSISLSLSSHLYYSTNACSKILRIIKKEQANQPKQPYIIPGKPSKIDIKLSSYLEVPILYNENEFSSTIFTKSGSRRIFELCEFSTPIGEWRISSKEDLFSKLVCLISDFPSINVWLFKTDDDFDGRGVGFIQLDKHKVILDFKRERLGGSVTKAKFESNLLSYFKSSLTKKIEVPNLGLYQSKEDFIESLIKKNGIIEACPSYLLSGITGSPSISFFIEPNGEVNSIYSYDKVSSKDFSLSCIVSPQSSVPNLNIRKIVEKVTEILYKEEVFGFITIDFISFTDGKKSLFWAIDLKSGLSDVYSHMEFMSILHMKNKQISTENDEENNEIYSFSIPFLLSKRISYIKMKNLISHFRKEHLVYDIDSNTGVIFSISDIIQSGAVGIFGKADSLMRNIQLLDNSVNSFKFLTSSHENSEEFNEDKEMIERFCSIKSYIKSVTGGR